MSTVPISGIAFVAGSVDGTEHIEILQGSQTKKVLLSTMRDYFKPSDLTGIGFQQLGTRGAVRASLDKLRECVSIEDYTLNTDTDCTAAANAALQFLKGRGGGALSASVPSYTIGTTIFIPDGCVIWGQGHSGTMFVLKANANCDAFQSEHFASLTGSGKWLTTDGVGYGFGLKHLTVDGNAANQSAGTGRCVAFFGKNYVMHDVVTMNAKGDGFYTECGPSTGDTSIAETAQAHITQCWFYDNQGNGCSNYGPHDAVWNEIVACRNGAGGSGYGMQSRRVVESDGTIISDGTCVVNNIHTFGNASGGWYSDAPVRSHGLMIFEDPATFAGNFNYLAEVKFALGSKSGTQLTISGHSSTIGSIWGLLHEPTSGPVQNGCSITGDYTQIGQVYINGNGLGGFGLELDANNIVIKGGNLYGFSGDSAGGGRSVKLATSGPCYGWDVNLSLGGGEYNIVLANAIHASKLHISSTSDHEGHMAPESTGTWVLENNDIVIWGGDTGGGTDYKITNAGWPGISDDFGDADSANPIPDGTKPNTLYWNTTLSADRNCYLATASGQNKGVTRRVVAGAIGGHNLIVHFASTTKTLAANHWIDIQSDGSHQIQTAAGSLV